MDVEPSYFPVAGNREKKEKMRPPSLPFPSSFLLPPLTTHHTTTPSLTGAGAAAARGRGRGRGISSSSDGRGDGMEECDGGASRTTCQMSLPHPSNHKTVSDASITATLSSSSSSAHELVPMHSYSPRTRAVAARHARGSGGRKGRIGETTHTISCTVVKACMAWPGIWPCTSPHNWQSEAIKSRTEHDADLLFPSFTLRSSTTTTTTTATTTAT